jgi:hypothetical protein
MVREKVADARGRRWVSGALDPDTYFAEVRRTARQQAREIVAARMRAAKPGKQVVVGH